MPNLEEPTRSSNLSGFIKRYCETVLFKNEHINYRSSLDKKVV